MRHTTLVAPVSIVTTNQLLLLIRIGAKAWLSTTVILAMSVWAYTVRFFGLNPQRSLVPCFVAHATKNVGVLAVKYVQGFMGGWW